MKEKLEAFPLRKRIMYGYKRVIRMMFVSGIISLVVIFCLLGNMIRYVQRVERADTAVKICRIDVNAAARNIREMALNSNKSAYDDYENQVKTCLDEVDK